MLVRCPECKTEFRLVGFGGDERVVRYFCAICDRIVRIDLELDEIPPGPGGKYQDFTSDFFPRQDSDATPDVDAPTSDRP